MIERPSVSGLSCVISRYPLYKWCNLHALGKVQTLTSQELKLRSKFVEVATIGCQCIESNV